MRRTVHKHNENKIKWFICLVLLMVLAVYSFVFTERIIKPNVAGIAKVKVESLITQFVNNSVRDQFKSGDEVRELLTIKTDQEGNITYVESNTTAMNSLATDLILNIQNLYKSSEDVMLEVPVGSIIGSQILSQIGPNVNLKVALIGTSKANFKTEFESMGINQTKYKVYLEMESQARVLSPFSINNIEVRNTILVAEAVIVGEVPDSYINVPPGSAMDATNFFTDSVPGM